MIIIMMIITTIVIIIIITGKTSCIIAAEKQLHNDVIRLLECGNKDAVVGSMDGRSILHIAAEKGVLQLQLQLHLQLQLLILLLLGL